MKQNNMSSEFTQNDIEVKPAEGNHVTANDVNDVKASYIPSGLMLINLATNNTAIILYLKISWLFLACLLGLRCSFAWQLPFSRVEFNWYWLVFFGGVSLIYWLIANPLNSFLQHNQSTKDLIRFEQINGFQGYLYFYSAKHQQDLGLLVEVAKCQSGLFGIQLQFKLPEPNQKNYLEKIDFPKHRIQKDEQQHFCVNVFVWYADLTQLQLHQLIVLARLI